MQRVIRLIEVKTAIAPSSLDLEIVYLRGDYHSFHPVIMAPLLTAGDQLSIDTGASKLGMHCIQNALTLCRRVLAQGDKAGDDFIYDRKQDA
jgi:hypothetical protein